MKRQEPREHDAASGAAMSLPAPEDRLAALREEIRRVGRCYQKPATWLQNLFILLVGGAVVAAEWLSGEGRILTLMLGLLILLTGCGALLCYFYSPLSRGARRRALLRKLECLPPEQQAAVLAPLRAETAGDTRQLIEPLLRDLGLPTELTPATTPEGTGWEVSGSPTEGTGP
jgi:hypothetical protein